MKFAMKFRHLLIQWLDFCQTCIDILWDNTKGVPTFDDLDPNYKNQKATKFKMLNLQVRLHWWVIHMDGNGLEYGICFLSEKLF